MEEVCVSVELLNISQFAGGKLYSRIIFGCFSNDVTISYLKINSIHMIIRNTDTNECHYLCMISVSNVRANSPSRSCVVAPVLRRLSFMSTLLIFYFLMMENVKLHF